MIARRRAGFTLIELLVVVSIIAVLAAILLPAIGLVRQQAKLSACANNQRQLGMAALARCGDAGELWQPCWDYGRTGVQANRIWRFRTDDPAAWLGSWDATGRSADELNLPDLLQYIDSGEASYNKNRTLNCPASQWVISATAPSDVSDYWYKQFDTPYVYLAHSSTWTAWTNAASAANDKQPGADRVLWSDMLLRWSGGGGQWQINHSPETAAGAVYGLPPIHGINQCYGDGHIERKGAERFDRAAMDAMSSDPTKCRWLQSAGNFNDKRFF